MVNFLIVFIFNRCYSLLVVVCYRQFTLKFSLEKQRGRPWRRSGKFSASLAHAWAEETEGLLRAGLPLPLVRHYRQLAEMDADTLGEIQTWINDMEQFRPGFNTWFRLEFQNRFPEFDDWKRRVIKKSTGTGG
jgi:hypothetical protein